MKKEKLLAVSIIFLILVPLVLAENEQINDYNNYNQLTLKYKIEGGFELQKTGSNPNVKEAEAVLTFFPRKDDIQKVQTISPFSGPNAKITQNPSEINYKWDNPAIGNFNFGVDSTISIDNGFVIINEKVNFPLDEPIINEYTEATEFIDINNEIKEQAQQIVAGEDDAYLASFKMATWINKNIEYNLTTLTAEVVQKSSWVLDNREGVCDEITNLFISMSRSVGIPARFVYGVSYTNIGYDWGPHGWAEVYLPDKGWVPFDVTYGQFGWIDPSHVKLKVKADSGDATVKYSWKSADTQLKANEIKMKTNLISKGNEIEPPIKITVHPMIEKVGPGSYVPIKLEVVNDNEYYFPDTFRLTKSPELIEENVKHVLLRPKEIKHEYWILKIPDEIEDSYIYTTNIEIEDQFHKKAISKITYGENYKTVTLDEAKEIVAQNGDRELNTISRNIELKCPIDKEIYSYEERNLVCNIRNSGNIPLKNLNICFTKDCQVTDLGIAEQKNITFPININPGEYIFKVKAYNNDVSITKDVQIKILSQPNLKIKRLDYPKEVSYEEKIELKLLLTTEAEVKDLKIKIGDEEFEISDLNNLVQTNLPVNSKELYSINEESFEIELEYKDKNNKKYEIKEKYPIKINNAPWYVKALSYLGLM